MISPPSVERVPGVVIGSAPELVAALEPRRPLVITDAFLAAVPEVVEIVETLDSQVVALPVGEPTIDAVTMASELVVEACPDIVVAIGGGSAIDTAKLAAAVAASGGHVSDYVRSARAFSRSVPIVALPTTSGAGAEVSRTAVVTEHGRKSWAWDESLRPTTVILDPVLTLGMPPSLTVSTGLDAFVHGFEAATSPNADPVAIRSGAEAVGAIRGALPLVARRPDDLAARTSMLLASVVAGHAIDRAGTGVGHAVGHALASLVTIPHGLAVAFGMRACLDWSMEGADGRLDRLRLDRPATELIDDLLDELAFTRHLDRWRSTRLEAPTLAEELRRPENQPMCANNVRPVSHDEVGDIALIVSSRWNAGLQ